MPSRTGTASQVDASGGDGSTSVTVPADATAAVAFWAQYDGTSANEYLATLTLGGNAFTIQEQINEGSQSPADNTGTGVATLTNLPGAGAQTLAWTYNAGGARQEGGGLLIVWAKDVNLADLVRDTACAAANGGFPLMLQSVDLTTASDDLVLGFIQSYSQDPIISGATTEFVNDWVVNLEHYDAGEFAPEVDNTTTITHTYGNYSTIAAISLKAATAAEKQTSYYRRMRTIARR